MTHNVVYRMEALADLRWLHDRIARKAGLVIADGYIRRIEAACAKLATFPERGTRRPEISQGLRTFGFERRVTIAFRVLKTEVEIVTIAYGGREFEDEIRDDG